MEYIIENGDVDILDSSYIFDMTKFSTASLKQYEDDVLIDLYDTDNTTKNIMIDDISNAIKSIDKAFSPLIGWSVSLYSLKEYMKKYPKIVPLMCDPVDPSLEPAEIEIELKERTNKVMDIMAKHPENDYSAYIRSKSNLKLEQLREYIIKIGPKSDINGNTIPINIDASFLFDGLYKPSYMYINALAGRKALIQSKLSMGGPGAFSKKLTYNSLTSTLRKDYEACDSIETIKYNIINDTFLKLLDGRYYYDKHGDLQLLDYKKDKHLIGKVVAFRSPTTCNSKEGVCKLCYGKLFDINKDMPSAGGLAALKLTEPIGQMILSSKHSQTTVSNKLTFSEGFDDLFETSSSMISIKEDSNLDADLYIRLNDVQVEENDDSEAYYITSFEILDENGEVIRKIREENDSKFYLNDQLISLYKSRSRKSSSPIISLDEIEDSDCLFTIEVKNKELNEPLKIFTKILNSKDHMGATSISEICQLFAEKLIYLGTKYNLVHGEMVIRNLIRKQSNIYEFPDFSKGGDPNDYQILKLDDAQLHNPSVLLSIPYGFLRRQLLSPETYKKTATGPLDALYVANLSKYL